MKKHKLKIAEKQNILNDYRTNDVSDNLFGRFWDEKVIKTFISTHPCGIVKRFDYSNIPKSIARLFAAKWAKGKDKDIELISLLMTYKPKQLVRIMNSLDKL